MNGWVLGVSYYTWCALLATYIVRLIWKEKHEQARREHANRSGAGSHHPDCRYPMRGFQHAVKADHLDHQERGDE